MLLFPLALRHFTGQSLTTRLVFLAKSKQSQNPDQLLIASDVAYNCLVKPERRPFKSTLLVRLPVKEVPNALFETKL